MPSLMLRSCLAFAAVALVLGGCERPFVEPTTPEIEVVGPDLSAALAEPILPLALRATSFRAVSRVEVQGEPAAYDADAGLFRDTVALEPGLNAIFVAAFDAAGVVESDTLYAVYLPHRFSALVSRPLPEPFGGHAAVALRDGRILFTGGAPAVNAPALDAAYLLDPGSLLSTAAPSVLNAARVGHTASLLPDGRVLIVGGARRLEPTAPADFVAEAELYDPATGRFSVVPVAAADGTPAEPVRRAWHTATVLEGEGGIAGVYLFGGLALRTGDGGAGPSPFMRTLRFEAGPDRLVAVGPADRFSFTPLARHTQTPLDETPGGFGRHLVVGPPGEGGVGVAPPFTFDFSQAGIDVRAVGAPAQVREAHAAAPLLRRLVLVAGGRAPGSGLPLPSAEVFAAGPDRFFRLPTSTDAAIPRWGHTATKLPDGRILLVGGFLSSGQAVQYPELFSSP